MAIETPIAAWTAPGPDSLSNRNLGSMRRSSRSPTISKGKTHPATGEEVKAGDFKYLIVDNGMFKTIEKTKQIEFEEVKVYAPVKSVNKAEEEEVIIEVIEPNFNKQEAPKIKYKSLSDIWKMKVVDIRAYAKEIGVSDDGKKKEVYERIKSKIMENDHAE